MSKDWDSVDTLNDAGERFSLDPHLRGQTMDAWLEFRET